MKDNKKRNLIIGIISLVFLIGVVGITYAFFNYTKTSDNNVLQVGTIEFSSTQTYIDLQNVFPTTKTNLNSTNSDTATITITGDTTYEQGIEYKVTIEAVNNTINGKELPISLNISANNLGTNSSNYYNERGSTTNVYKLTEEGEAYNGKYVIVGYIKPDTTGVNGSINITAFIDTNKIVISDTYDGTGTGLMGTTDEEVAGREVFTTTEWNSFNSSNPLSFKVKVEAQEGIWVEPEKFLTMKNLYSDSNWSAIRANITSIEFHKDSIAPANPITSFDVTDTTSDSSKGNITLYTVDDGLGNNTYKAIVVANDTIYAPEDSSSLFKSMSNLATFDSKNFKVDNSINMKKMFDNCENLTNIDSLSNWNVSNVMNVDYMFQSNLNINNLNALSNWNVSNVKTMIGMFNICSNLSDINFLSNWNVGNVTSMQGMFSNNPNIDNLNALSNWNVGNVTSMQGMFSNNPNIDNLNALSNWNVSNVENMNMMFSSCGGLDDASGINDWNINPNATFKNMFRGTPSHPEFTQLAGTWSNGTFTPNA